MTTPTPPQPTCRSIFAGFALGLLLLIAFLSLPDLVKYTGAALTFLPGQLRLIDVASAREVMQVDMNVSPSQLTFTRPGRYSLFTDNYDLLVINDAVVEANGKPWLKILTDSNDEIRVRMIERGLAIFDTPLAKGRPVAGFEIFKPGIYTMYHPTRPAIAYIVPDYTTGHEKWILFLMVLQVVLIVWLLRKLRMFWTKQRMARNQQQNTLS